MAFLKILGLLLLFTVDQTFSQNGEWPGIVQPLEKGCLMGAICHRNEQLGNLNCLADDPNHPEDRLPHRLFNATGIAMLREYCGDTLDGYGEEEDGGYDLCCDEEQIYYLVNNFALISAFLKKCPSCWRNVRQTVCELTCSPYQVHFLRAVQILYTSDYEENPRRPRMVGQLALYQTERYAEASYESCKNIKMGEYNDVPAMEFLCGAHGAERCNAERFFDFIGTINFGPVPVQTEFLYPSSDDDNVNVTAFDGVTHPCTAAWPGDSPCEDLHCKTGVTATAPPSTSTTAPTPTTCPPVQPCPPLERPRPPRSDGSTLTTTVTGCPPQPCTPPERPRPPRAPVGHDDE